METYDGPAFTRLSLCRSSLGVVLGDLVDVATWGIVPCVSKIDTLGGGGEGCGGGGGRGCVVGDNTRLEFCEVDSKGAPQPFIIVYVELKSRN